MENNGNTLAWRMGEVEAKLKEHDVKLDKIVEKMTRVEGMVALIRWAIVLGASIMSGAAVLGGWLAGRG